MKPGAVSIRPLTGEAEARACAELLVASEPWVTLGLTFAQALARLTHPTREILVVPVNDQIVGVMILDLAGPLNGYIQILAVHPDWRGRGVGSQMITWAEERIFRQSPNVFLCVSSFNERAQIFYQRLGYQRVGELPDFLTAGHAEMLLRKTRGPWLAFPPAR
jgi:ribosomal protein S18 acetylase RimI-like enzyme